jgi:hypothetical protein
MKKTLFTAVLIAATALSSLPSAAQVCGKRDTVLSRLADKFGETRRSLGLGANNGVVEIFASDDTGSWTITVTMPDGRMCLVASGQSYEDTVDPLNASDDA